MTPKFVTLTDALTWMINLSTLLPTNVAFAACFLIVLCALIFFRKISAAIRWTTAVLLRTIQALARLVAQLFSITMTILGQATIRLLAIMLAAFIASTIGIPHFLAQTRIPSFNSHRQIVHGAPPRPPIEQPCLECVEHN